MIELCHFLHWVAGLSANFFLFLGRIGADKLLQLQVVSQSSPSFMLEANQVDVSGHDFGIYRLAIDRKLELGPILQHQVE